MPPVDLPAREDPSASSTHPAVPLDNAPDAPTSPSAPPHPLPGAPIPVVAALPEVQPLPNAISTTDTTALNGADDAQDGATLAEKLSESKEAVLAGEGKDDDDKDVKKNKKGREKAKAARGKKRTPLEVALEDPDFEKVKPEHRKVLAEQMCALFLSSQPLQTRTDYS